MIQTCRACQNPFEITEDDLTFYEKASPVFAGKKELIPPPTLCPPCRNKRRMAWRNERSLYNGKCGLCGQDGISAFRPDSPVHTYCPKCYYTDKWDPLLHGREYDFSAPFVENFKRLLSDVPLMTLYQSGVNENCDYINFAGSGCKNCYLIFNGGSGCEDCYYARGLVESKNCMDMLIANGCQYCRECLNCSKCYRLFFSQNCAQCRDSFFLFDCADCSNCIGCTNLRHKEYYIFNQPSTKEQYEQFISRMGSQAFFLQCQAKFGELVKQGIHRENNNINVENCQGDYNTNCQNCFDCFESKGAQDCRYLTSSKMCRDSRDLFGFGYDSELLYEDIAVGHSTRTAFSFTCDAVSDALYCLYCQNTPNCFACIGLHHKQYCVFNKQYTKEEYEALVPRIIRAMSNDESRMTNGGTVSAPLSPSVQSGDSRHQEGSDQSGDSQAAANKGGRGDFRFGEFLPSSLSPFGYNETVGMEYEPMTKGEALAQGFNWSDYVAPPPKVEKVIKASQLPDSIFQIPDSVLDWAVECEVTGKPFRVIKPELKFLRENNLPFPRRHPDTRHFDRVAMRNPRKLFDRACAKCAKTMKTSSAPERPERVYCEECYRKEVY